MNKTLKIILIVLTTITTMYLLSLILVPNFIYQSIDKVSKSDYLNKEYFITDYDQIRENFFNKKEELVTNGYDTQIYSHAINAEDNLYIDTLYIKPKSTQENLICISTGVHGIEAYIGAVMIEIFFDNIFNSIDMTNTGIVIVSNVNPYGVKYGRRFNENNVDLNRNFISNWDTFDKSINKDYPKVKSFLEPNHKIGNYFNNEISFYSKLAFQAITNGVSTVTNALVGGQYEYPNGVYYGGSNDQLSTIYLKQVFNHIIDSNYNNITYIDIHSGYGPRDNMIIFNSGYDPMTEQEAKDAYNYDYIIAHDSKDFYATTGDTTEYFYKIAQNTNKDLYATCFEFGTLGDSLLAGINSLKYTVEENQNHRFKTNSKTTQNIIDAHYMEMFFPSETKWRLNAMNTFHDAMNGVLNYRLNK